MVYVKARETAAFAAFRETCPEAKEVGTDLVALVELAIKRIHVNSA